MTIQIRNAVREGARLVFAFSGWSGDGKTVSAILFGYGLANFDASKLGFLDTENKRGSLNADILSDPNFNPNHLTNVPFKIGDLYAPFTPRAYVEAIHEFQKAGVEVLIIDTVSHEWEGIGGCIEMADNMKGMWNKPKAEHKFFMNSALQCDMHIIFCVRAREKDKPEKVNGKTEFVKMGLQPIQEKNFMFEMTASLMMHEQGTLQTPLKVPGMLQSALGRRQGYITPDDGKFVRDWVDGAKQLDPKVENYKNRLLVNAEKGVAHVKELLAKNVPEQMQKAMGEGFIKSLLKSAERYDQIRAETISDGPAPDAQQGATSRADAIKATLEATKTDAANSAFAAASAAAQAPADPPAKEDTPARAPAVPETKPDAPVTRTASTHGPSKPPASPPSKPSSPPTKSAPTASTPKQPATPPAKPSAPPAAEPEDLF